MITSTSLVPGSTVMDELVTRFSWLDNLTPLTTLVYYVSIMIYLA